MSPIEKQMEREQQFVELVGLLEKIYAHNKPCKVEINFDGFKFASWNIHASNLTAEDWNPTRPERPVAEVKKDVSHSGSRMIHRKSIADKT
jgi:hypothetical protein